MVPRLRRSFLRPGLAGALPEEFNQFVDRAHGLEYPAAEDKIINPCNHSHYNNPTLPFSPTPLPYELLP